MVVRVIVGRAAKKRQVSTMQRKVLQAEKRGEGPNVQAPLCFLAT